MKNKAKIDCVDRESRTNETVPPLPLNLSPSKNGKVLLKNDLSGK